MPWINQYDIEASSLTDGRVYGHVRDDLGLLINSDWKRWASEKDDRSGIRSRAALACFFADVSIKLMRSTIWLLPIGCQMWLWGRKNNWQPGLKERQLDRDGRGTFLFIELGEIYSDLVSCW